MKFFCRNSSERWGWPELTWLPCIGGGLCKYRDTWKQDVAGYHGLLNMSRKWEGRRTWGFKTSEPGQSWHLIDLELEQKTEDWGYLLPLLSFCCVTLEKSLALSGSHWWKDAVGSSDAFHSKNIFLWIIVRKSSSQWAERWLWSQDIHIVLKVTAFKWKFKEC